MAFKESKKVDYDIQVKDVREFKPTSKKITNSVGFTMIVNGITIYGCIFNEGHNDKGDWSAINFPSRAGKDGKYYNHVWFPISSDMREDIRNMLIDSFV